MGGSKGRGRVCALVGGGLVVGVATMVGGTSAAAVACSNIFDVNGDGRADLPLGTPAEDVGTVVDAGAVTVLLGNGTGGFTGTGSRQIVQGQVGQTSERGDRFGASIATLDWNPLEDACTDLAIGIPGEDGAIGRVVVVLGSPTGLDLSRRIVLRQGVGGTPDTGEAGDRFGETMIASGTAVTGTTAALVVGVPGEDVGAVVDAGVVDVFRFDPTTADGFPTAGAVVRQGAGGVPDAPERGDGFGSSLAAADHGLFSPMVIGAPGEDIAGVADAGLVHEFTGDVRTHEVVLHQNSARVPDANEAGDRFGTAVGFVPGPCVGPSFYPGLLVGTPGEDIGARVDAGAVTMLEPENPADVGNLLRQGVGGIPGTPQSGDRFGASLARLSLEVAIGVPGQDVGAAADAGTVALARIGCAGSDPFVPRDVVVLSAREFSQNSTGVPDAAENGDRFGTRLTEIRTDVALSLVATGPSEKVGSVIGAGIVHTFRTNASALVQVSAGQAFTQNSPGVPDMAEARDGFGAVLD